MIITKKGAAERTIAIEETFRAPREKVFKAWTTPESLKKWFMAEEGVVVTDASLELQEGGSYLINVLFPGYDPTPIQGEFLSVNIPDKLEYTWLTPVLNGRSTLVNVAFIDLEKGSKILLRHGEFISPEEMQLHIDGWNGCLAKLHEFLG